MLFDVIDYGNQVIGQIEADDQVNAWEMASKKYNLILDVRPSTSYFIRKELVEELDASYAFVAAFFDEQEAEGYAQGLRTSGYTVIVKPSKSDISPAIVYTVWKKR